MKRSLFISAAAVLLPFAVWAQKEVKTASNVAEATVYLQGAEVVHTAGASLEAGRNTVVITNICRHLDAQSIRVKATGGALISSHEFLPDYLNKRQDDPRLRMLADSIGIYEEKQRVNDIEIGINSDMIELLQTGIKKNVSGSEQGLGIDDLVKTMDYYNGKAGELQAVKSRLEKEKTDIADKLKRLRTQLNLEKGIDTDYDAVIKLDINMPVARSVEFTVTYHTQRAGWSPVYDVNVGDTDRPVEFAMRARVWQRTGRDWKDMKLTLSTASPTYGKTAPEYSAWVLENRQVDTGISRALSGKMAGINVENKLDEVVVVGYGASSPDIRIRGTSSSSAEPVYILNGEQITSSQMQGIDPGMIERINVLKDKDATAVYGSRGSNGVIEITTKTSITDYVAGSESVNSVEYNIDLPYTIPTGNQPRVIDLRNFTAEADFKYYTAPKLDQETYVIAELKDWNTLQLIAGKANITFNGTYIGETKIDPASINDKLTITLGVDKRVSVRREKVTENTATRFLGSDVQQTFAYKVTVRNNMNRPVDIVVTDQYPISINNYITVTVNSRESTPWTSEDPTKGVISWESTFEPGQNRTFELNYTVKYPKGYNLNL